MFVQVSPVLFQESLIQLVEIDFEIFVEVVDVRDVAAVPSRRLLKLFVIFDHFRIFYDVVDVKVVDVKDVEGVSVSWRLTLLLVGVIAEDMLMFVKLVTTSFPRAARSTVVDVSAANLQRSWNRLQLTKVD